MAIIPAIVLTYDANRPYALHMMRLYDRLWPDHPFRFHIPFQKLDVFDDCLVSDSRVQMCAAPVSIRQTVLTLLDQFADDQWIYWCIDDKYPTSIDTAYLKSVAHTLLNRPLPAIDGICFCRTRRLRDGRALMVDHFGLWKVAFCSPMGFLFRRSHYAQIWLHQFVRVRVLRHLFTSFPEVSGGAKELDALKELIPLPDSHRIFVTRGHYASFGESTSRGIVTANCAVSMLHEGIDPREPWPAHGKSITIGDDAASLDFGLVLRDVLSIMRFVVESARLRLSRYLPFRHSPG